ncbi:hypothetical protein EB73_06665 [Mycobacterium sp. SWH-M3]|nr:hypothetical protein EB73_06665 [Mycobacterium sp. SWH-M3]
MPDKWHKAEEKPTHRDPADSAIDRIRASLSELGRTVWANRHHHITIGRAGHDEVRAARAAAAAHRRGMTYKQIADAMHLKTSDISAWLGPEANNTPPAPPPGNGGFVRDRIHDRPNSPQ